MTRLLFVTLALALLASSTRLSWAQDSEPIQVDLNAVDETLTSYPTTIPVMIIRVRWVGLSNQYDLVDADKAVNWQLVHGNDKITPEVYEPNIAAKTVLLRIPDEHGLKTGDTINVVFLNARKLPERTNVAVQQKGVKVNAVLEFQKLKIDLQYVPKQKLTDGNKSDVAHIPFSLDIPSLAKNNYGRIYLISDNQASTNRKDKTAKYSIKLGAIRQATPYIRLPIEMEIKSNQEVSYASFVVGAGPRGVFSLNHIRDLVWNDLFKAPFSPVFEIRPQYENRFINSSSVGTSHANHSSFQLFSQISWKPIYLFAGKGKDFHPNSAPFLEILAKGWYFPSDSAIGGFKTHRVEGRIETSIVFQVHALGTHKRIRLKYTDGAVESSGFSRSHEFTFGIEDIK